MNFEIEVRKRIYESVEKVHWAFQVTASDNNFPDYENRLTHTNGIDFIFMNVK